MLMDVPSENPSHGPVSPISPTAATRPLAQQLHDASLRYRRLVEANIIGVAVATEAGIEEANDEILRLAGTTRARFEAEGLDWQAITPPEDLPKDMRGLQEIVERGACAPFEKAFVHADGTRVPILVGGALLDRAPLRWIAFALDLTERKHAEAERDRLLEEARASRDVAEGALQARDALLAWVTHDLRTPIAANYGYASLMTEGIPEPLPPAHRETVRRIMANQQHMMLLIDRLLDFARGAPGGGTVEPATLDVDELLAGIEPLVAPQIREAGITYECPACESPLAVRADRTKAMQILVNLVGNAIKFTPAGGRVTVAAAAADGEVRITVTDTGIGIAPEQIGRIFDPFVQADAATAQPAAGRPRGVGLGLAISRELARGMGGSLRVESVEGSGSTFALTLPRV